MSVSEILATKGGSVFTVDAATTLTNVAKTLAEKKIGAAIVLNSQGTVCGIASERDIVRQIAENGAIALDQPIEACMTHKVVSCKTDDTIDTVMEKMTHGRFRHLPVIEDDKLMGIISIGDVVKRKIEQAEHDVENMKRYIAG